MEQVPHIKDIALVKTMEGYKSFLTKQGEDYKARYVLVPKKFEYGKSYFFEKNYESDDNGFVIIPQNNVELSYVAFLLNSLIVALSICEGDLRKSVTLTKKKLEDIPVRYTDEDRMYFLGLCNKMIQAIHKHIEKNEDSDYDKFLLSMFCEVRDGMSLELVAESLLLKYDIHIIDEWINLLLNADDPLSVPKLAVELRKDDNALMNQIKKMRLLLNIIFKQYNDTTK